MSELSRTVALVPARLDSTRLPQKQLRPIDDQAMLAYLVNRMNSVPAIDQVVVATTERPIDDPLVDWATNRNLAIFRGDHKDVLSRFDFAARAFEADIVVRANGDNPLLSPTVTQNGIERLKKENLAFVTGKQAYTGLPVGIGPEILQTTLLTELTDKATDTFHREHVTSYIFDHPELFEWGAIPTRNSWDAPDLSVTVDTAADLEYVRNVVSRLPNRPPSEWSVEDIIEAHREIDADATDD
jgi:spore coat polysaccharide biosynthesis protein SpsF